MNASQDKHNKQLIGILLCSLSEYTYGQERKKKTKDAHTGVSTR